MANVYDFRGAAAAQQKQDALERNLTSGNGGGTSDGMLEQRVARLEEDVREVRTDVRAIRDELGGAGGIRERLTRIEATMATKGEAIALAVAIVGAIVAFTTIQDQIKTLLGFG